MRRQIFPRVATRGDGQHCRIGNFPASDVAWRIADNEHLVEGLPKLCLRPLFSDWAQQIPIPAVVGKCANAEAIPQTVRTKLHLGATPQVPGEQPDYAAVPGT